MTQGDAVAAVFIAGGVGAIAFGFGELAFPSVFIRWQIRSTSRARGLNRAIGEWFQQRYEHPTVGADTDPGVRRRVRWTGLLLVVFGAGCVAAGALVWG
jgi:hypothetical protein